MEAMAPNEFRHTTLAVYPETHIGNGKYTPKAVGITLLDEKPGFTGIYLRDANGGLWPARTVDRSRPEHYRSVIASWSKRENVVDDRKYKGPTVIDNFRRQLEEAGVNVVMESDDKLISDTDGFYERFGSNECSHVGFEAIDWGDNWLVINVSCPVESGGKTENYNSTKNNLDDGIKRIIELFAWQ